MAKKKKSTSLIFKIILLAILLIFGGSSLIAYEFYQRIYTPNVNLEGKKTDFIYIGSNFSFEDMINYLHESGIIINKSSFEWVAERKKFSTIKPGKYLVTNNMTNNDLINLLRSGKQTPVKITYNNVRLKEELAGIVAKSIEADSLSLITLLKNETVAQQYGFSTENFMSMFIPNTYEFYWNTSSEEFMQRAHKEYKAFWNETRLKKAKQIQLLPIEVSILASIVQSETKMNDEKSRVAGVYLNRLRAGMLLQADPTLVYANGDFSIKRVLNIHKEIDSPYNTYKYKGLPPGPIVMADISSIDAVLNTELHAYFYFCAKEDFSGYHNFAKTLSQHNTNAIKFQRALNKRKIYK